MFVILSTTKYVEHVLGSIFINTSQIFKFVKLNKLPLHSIPMCWYMAQVVFVVITHLNICTRLEWLIKCC